MNLSMDRFRRHAAPQALLVLATFLLSMTPRRAAANNDPPPPETASETAPQAAAAATAEAEIQSSSAAAAPSDSEHETPKESTTSGVPELNAPKHEIPGFSGGGKIMSLPTGENKTGVSSQAIATPKGPGTIQGMGESFSAQPSTGIVLPIV